LIADSCNEWPVFFTADLPVGKHAFALLSIKDVIRGTGGIHFHDISGGTHMPVPATVIPPFLQQH
jgi:hypothetical protein